jgi:hypothetical protein
MIAHPFDEDVVNDRDHRSYAEPRDAQGSADGKRQSEDRDVKRVN